MKLALFVIFIFTPLCLSSQVITVNYDSNKSRASLDGMNLSDEMKARMTKGYKGLLTHYTVRSDGNQVVCSLDSLTQKCGEEDSSVYPYKRISVKDENDNWLDYRMIIGYDEAEKKYKILKSKDIGSWIVDYKSTKNILGFKCYQVKNETDRSDVAWITFDLPYSVSPVEQVNLTGVILEYFDGATTYTAKNVTIDKKNQALPKIYTSGETVESCKNFSDFVQILMSKTPKMSSNMFLCREE